jgi:hypothetical protein
MNDKLQQIWKEVVMAITEALSWNLSGWMDDNHEKTQARMTDVLV